LLAAAENWRDLKTQKKIKILFGGVEAGCCRKLAGSENPKKNLRFFLRKGSWLLQKIGGI
jgi:hypothetical protein